MYPRARKFDKDTGKSCSSLLESFIDIGTIETLDRARKSKSH